MSARALLSFGPSERNFFLPFRVVSNLQFLVVVELRVSGFADSCSEAALNSQKLTAVPYHVEFPNMAWVVEAS